MGREIRKVPKGWEHPRNKLGHFQPLHDRTYREAAERWLSECLEWSEGKSEYQKDLDIKAKYQFFWDWSGSPPNEKYYRPEFSAPADCFQIYENVSEGTPCSPVFESIEGMIDWMTRPIDRSSEFNKGEDWQCMQGMTLEQAKKFCEYGSSPSLIFTPSTGVVAGHRMK